MFKLTEIEDAATLVHQHVPPTPQYRWPLLCRRTGSEVWVKHENHTPIGAFKLRGGITYLSDLRRRQPGVPGVITATRGNHGQSIASAAALLGLESTVVVPEGNSVEKNAAMKAQGANLVVHGHDFQAALEHARELAAANRLHMIESFNRALVVGVASYGFELFCNLPDLDTVYVPIGLGSGICGTMASRDALDRKTKVVGVVAENAAAYALSFAQGKPVSTNSADTFADGMACRVPVPEAVNLINAGAERIVTVTEEEIKSAVRAYYSDTHNLAEGAGAAPLAALIKESDRMAGKKVGLILSGGNIDRQLYREILAEA